MNEELASEAAALVVENLARARSLEQEADEAPSDAVAATLREFAARRRLGAARLRELLNQREARRAS